MAQGDESLVGGEEPPNACTDRCPTPLPGAGGVCVSGKPGPDGRGDRRRGLASDRVGVSVWGGVIGALRAAPVRPEGADRSVLSACLNLVDTQQDRRSMLLRTVLGRPERCHAGRCPATPTSFSIEPRGTPAAPAPGALRGGFLAGPFRPATPRPSSEPLYPTAIAWADAGDTPDQPRLHLDSPMWTSSWNQTWWKTTSSRDADVARWGFSDNVGAGRGSGRRGRLLLHPSGRRFNPCRAHQCVLDLCPLCASSWGASMIGTVVARAHPGRRRRSAARTARATSSSVGVSGTPEGRAGPPDLRTSGERRRLTPARGLPGARPRKDQRLGHVGGRGASWPTTIPGRGSTCMRSADGAAGRPPAAAPRGRRGRIVAGRIGFRGPARRPVPCCWPRSNDGQPRPEHAGVHLAQLEG